MKLKLEFTAAICLISLWLSLGKRGRESMGHSQETQKTLYQQFLNLPTNPILNPDRILCRIEQNSAHFLPVRPGKTKREAVFFAIPRASLCAAKISFADLRDFSLLFRPAPMKMKQML
ncbi:MAG: hypothetical protein AB1813_22825, partial [Verrucomicrobiota bacterium]